LHHEFWQFIILKLALYLQRFCEWIMRGNIMKGEENKKFIWRFVEETINKKNLNAIDELVEPDFVERVPLPGQGPGRDGLKYAIGMLLAAFPDMKWTTDEQIAEGDKVVSRFTWTGTHQGEFLGIPPTQRQVTVWGVVIDVVREGRFAESRLIMDTMSLMQQLGVVPTPGKGTGTRPN
jgi:predicted ester cyclase